MAALILPSRRVVQPQGPVQIDFGNPLAQGGGIAVAPFSRDLLAAGTNARIHVGPQGFELGVNALVAGPAFSLSSPNAAGTSGADGFTQLIVFRRFGGATSTPSVFIEETAGGYFRNAFYYNGSSWVWRTRDTATGDTGSARDLTLTAPVTGAVDVRAFVVKPGAKRAFRNGRLDNSTATAAEFTATDSSAFQFAHSVSGGSSYSGDSRIALYASINRALSDSEVAALSANPWQIFKPVERRIWVPVSGGGVPVGVSTETDTATSLAGKLHKTLGLAAEVDSAQTLAGIGKKAVTVGLETDTAQVLLGQQITAVQTAFETDTAFALSPAVGGFVSAAAETDTALALAGRVAKAAETAAEIDAAVALVTLARGATGTSSTVDSTQALAAKALAPALPAFETDAAFALPAAGTSALPVLAAAETDTAFALSSVYVPPVTGTGGGGGGGGGHTGAAARKHRWEADKKLWSPSEKQSKPAPPIPAAPKLQPVKLRDTAAARALLEKALVPKAATAFPSVSIVTTIVEDTSELDEEFEALLAFALLD